MTKMYQSKPCRPEQNTPTFLRKPATSVDDRGGTTWRPSCVYGCVTFLGERCRPSSNKSRAGTIRRLKPLRLHLVGNTRSDKQHGR